MAKLSELISQDMKNSIVETVVDTPVWVENPLVVKLSKALGISVRRARVRYAKFGNGYIYFKSGDVILFSQSVFDRLVNRTGQCVAISQEGELLSGKKINWDDFSHNSDRDILYAQMNKEAKRIRTKRYAEFCLHREELYMQRNEQDRKQLFKDCQGNPSPKRAGKANSLDDMGNYVHIPHVDYGMFHRSFIKHVW